LAKFRADVAEERVYPSLGITVKPDDVVELPADTVAAGLVLVEGKSSKAAVVAEESAAAVAQEQGA
jgi:hypothetical protein